MHRTYLKHILLLWLFNFTTTLLLAQPANRPPDRLKMLNAFNGEWKGEIETVVEKKKIKFKLTHTSQKIAGGWGVQLSEVAMIPQQGKYHVARIFSQNLSGDTTYMYTIDSNGETWFYTGIWEGNKRLILKTSDKETGNSVSKTIQYTFISPKQYAFKSITRSEGKEDETVEMTMVKQ